MGFRDHMSGDHTILLISDRPNRSRDLARSLGSTCRCQTIGLDEKQSAVGPVVGVVLDVSFRQPRHIERLRQLLARPRASAVPTIAVLRDDSHLERMQAAAVGVANLLPADTPISHIAAALAPIIQSASPRAAPAASLTPTQNIEQARHQFGTLLGAAARGQPVGRTEVESATASVMTAIADAGIRQWLEVVWTYDDGTYQHCLLVTGLAAEFAASLHFARHDQQDVIRGALLHDIGKAKIPLAILNKPGPLTQDETTVMRTHAKIGYDILQQQGDYEPGLLDVVLRHHELLDGSGYPDGLAGPQIPDLVRLVTICDVYAALIERRPYREPMQPARAFKILQEMEGKLEGPLVRAFMQVADKSAAAQHVSVPKPA